MGRGKIEIKRIEDTSNRQVTYSKRRNGILKKAKEITVLCDAKVSLVVFGSSGKMHEFCSPSTTLVDILEKYHQQSGKRLWDAKHENLSNELDRIKKENDSLQIELRHLKGEDITSLQPRDLMAIENTLETGLESVRYKQSEIHRMMKINGKMLEEDNKQLNLILHQQEMERESRELENGYHRQVNDYQPQMPFTFRVQPIQPNLHERI
uniref:MADS-box transcription factor GLOBOSA-like protein n=1 Tax=Camellia sinensis TaxID=4442 RepID=A0A068AZ63_CAMSI|nr:MADS-box transcription factor GLOBOSA-like protein [Camellia sinensis]